MARSRSRPLPPWERGMGGGGAGAGAAGAEAGSREPCLSRAVVVQVANALRSELQRLQEATQDAMLDGGDGAPTADSSPQAQAQAQAQASRVRSLARRLGWLRSDACVLLPHAKASGAARLACDVHSLCELSDAAEDFARSLCDELRAQAKVREEERYATALGAAAALHVAAVPRDGDCLFASVLRWRDGAGASPEAEPKQPEAPPADSPSAVVQPEVAAQPEAAAQAAGTQSARSPRARARSMLAAATTPLDVRAAVVAALRERLRTDGAFCAQIDATLADAARGTDGTSVRLRAALADLQAERGAELSAVEAREACTPRRVRNRFACFEVARFTCRASPLLSHARG